MEKLHGTSSHVRWADGKVWYSPGGESHAKFAGVFDEVKLTEAFTALGHDTVIVYGEAYGGKQQAQSWRYGKELKFAAFDVQIGGIWLDIPAAHDVTTKLGLEFVHYERCSTDLAALDAQRDAPSTQAKRNGVEGEHPREGVVLRPIVELCYKTGERICAKHKRDEERETATPRKVVDPAQMEVLTKAASIAMEWVTETRLQHVLDALRRSPERADEPLDISNTRDVIVAMIADVVREGAGEFVDTKEARQAIGKRAADLFKAKIRSALREEA